MATATDLILSSALEYASYGWCIVPLHHVKASGACSCRQGASCHTPGKHPAIKEWQKFASSDEDQIIEWFEKWPDANVGFALGKASRVIDFEFDSERQRQIFLDLFGGDHPVTTCYESHRGQHYLFEWQENLPGGATLKLDELVIRLGNNETGAMSVLPPSMHPSGQRYKWLLPPSDCTPIALPASVVTSIWNWDASVKAGDAKPQEYWLDLAKGVSKGSRNESAAEFIGRMLRDLRNPFDANAIERVFELFVAWNDRNSPKLDDDELAKTFASILKIHRRQVLSEQGRQSLNGEQSWEPRRGEVIPDWHVTIVESQPRVIRLRSPLWSMKAPKGYIELSSRQYRSWDAICEQALEQADVYVTGKMKSEWQGSKDNESLARKLIDAAEYLAAPLESKREQVVADLLLDQLSKARPLADGQEANPTRPFIDRDGSVCFKFTAVFEELSFSQDKIKRNELSSLLSEVGATDGHFGHADKRFRLKKLSRAQLRTLRMRDGFDDDCSRTNSASSAHS
jgi:hypothetical protein